ncbi:hypothetical protein Tco_1086951 [Tanacetum coccineum]
MPSALATHLTITSNHLPRQHLWPPTSSPPPPTNYDASNHNASNHHPPDRPLPTISFQIHEDTFFFVLSRMAARSCLTRSRVALRSAMKRIVNAFGPGFDYWEWRLATLPFAFGGLGMALWQSQMEDHTADWLRVVLISGLGQTMNTCSKVITGENNGDHVVSCASIIEVDIGLGKGCDKPLRHADMLLYSWDGGLDMCVDLTGSSPLTQTGMVDLCPVVR